MNSIVATHARDWPAATLAEVERRAALQTRVDRKYVVTPTELTSALDSVRGGLRVLDIAGERVFGYHSTYFDTADLTSFRAAASGRRRRFKVRTRADLTTGTTWLEVKLHERSGLTSKHRVEHPIELELGATAGSFLGGFDQVRPHLGALQATIATTYERTTLLCTAPEAAPDDASGAAQRITIDVDVVCRRPDGTPIATLGRYLIVETKSHDARPGPLDRALWRGGARPLPLSKYAIGLACARADLTANRWRRVLHRYVQPTDAG